MGRSFALVLVAPALFLILSWLNILGLIQEDELLMNELLLAVSVDYAVDAATEEMLAASTIVSGTEIEVNPDVAKSVFLSLMCLNYDLPTTQQAFMELETSYLPVFCVAAYDGYYLYTPTVASDGGVYLQCSLKQPYSYWVGDTYYALNLGGETTYKLYDGALASVTLVGQGITANDVATIVNTTLSDVLMEAFQEQTGRSNEFVYIPTQMTTLAQTSAVEGPAVLAFVDNWDFRGTSAVSSFSVGGAQLTEVRQVAAYTTADGLFYTYVDLLPITVTADRLFTSEKEAAQAGYSCDPDMP